MHSLRSKRLVERDAHALQIDEADAFLAGDLAHGLRIVAMRVLDFVLRVESPALHRSYQYRRHVPQSGFSDVRTQVGAVGGMGVNVGLRPVFLLVVVAKLNQQVVARLCLTQQLREPEARDKRF